MGILIKQKYAIRKNSTTIMLVIAISAIIGFGSIVRSAFAQDDGPTAISETFGDWTVSCQASSGKDQPKRNCQMTQEQINPKSNQRVFLIALGAPDAKTGASETTLILPFGLDLAKGIEIKVDESSLVKANLSTCLPIGCIAPFSFDSKSLERLAKGKQAAISMSTVNNNQDVTNPISLKGFSAASARLVVLMKS